MDRVDSLLFLLMLGHFLRSDDTVELIDLVDVCRLFVVKVLVEGGHGVLHVESQFRVAALLVTAGGHASIGGLVVDGGGGKVRLLEAFVGQALLRHVVFVKVAGGW